MNRKTTEKEKMIDELFKSIVYSPKRFFIDSDKEGEIRVVIQIDDILDCFKEFKKKWNSDNA